MFATLFRALALVAGIENCFLLKTDVSSLQLGFHLITSSLLVDAHKRISPLLSATFVVDLFLFQKSLVKELADLVVLLSVRSQTENLNLLLDLISGETLLLQFFAKNDDELTPITAKQIETSHQIDPFGFTDRILQSHCSPGHEGGESSFQKTFGCSEFLVGESLSWGCFGLLGLWVRCLLRNLFECRSSR